MDQVLQQLLTVADLLEQTLWERPQEARYAQSLASALRGYAVAAQGGDIAYAQQADAISRLESLQGAIYSRNLFDAYYHSQALIGSLPGDAKTLPTPPWKR